MARSSYYEVLQAQQELYPTQRAQVQTQVGELNAVVQLYQALGGGVAAICYEFSEPLIGRRQMNLAVPGFKISISSFSLCL